MAEKLYYSMSEVAEMFDVNQSLIRYWESKFDSLRPKKNKKGNRMFRPEDIENFKIIYHLVKECGMTLDGAKRAMKQQGTEKVSRNAELLEKLQSVRSMLAEVREILKDGEGGALLDEDLAENEEVANAPEIAYDAHIMIQEMHTPYISENIAVFKTKRAFSILLPPLFGIFPSLQFYYSI